MAASSSSPTRSRGNLHIPSKRNRGLSSLVVRALNSIGECTTMKLSRWTLQKVSVEDIESILQRLKDQGIVQNCRRRGNTEWKLTQGCQCIEESEIAELVAEDEELKKIMDAENRSFVMISLNNLKHSTGSCYELWRYMRDHPDFSKLQLTFDEVQNCLTELLASNKLVLRYSLKIESHRYVFPTNRSSNDPLSDFQP